MKADDNQQAKNNAATGQSEPPRRDETTGKDNPELPGESPHATPGQAEGDRATVEESLRQKGLDDTQSDES